MSRDQHSERRDGVHWQGVETLYDDDNEVRYEGPTRTVVAETETEARRELGRNQPSSGYLHIHDVVRCS